MKNVKLCIGIIIGLVLSGITVYALSINSKDVSYKTTNVSDAIDDLYEKVTNSASKFCELKSGNALEVGSMYECDPGDGVKRNFYILSLNSENGVDLIMDRHIGNSTMTWSNAMKYFKAGEGLAIKNSWTNVLKIDLPSAQAIVDAADYGTWIVAENNNTWWCFGSHTKDLNVSPWCSASTNAPYYWLFDHLTNSVAAGGHDNSDSIDVGYWTRDITNNTNPVRAWCVYEGGYIEGATIATPREIRPVITVLKGNLK